MEEEKEEKIEDTAEYLLAKEIHALLEEKKWDFLLFQLALLRIRGDGRDAAAPSSSNQEG